MAGQLVIELKRLRDLTLEAPSAPGRPHHLAAASGLVRVGANFYVVADDELHLGVFPVSGLGPGRLHRVFQGPLPAEKKARKAAKPDLEALVALPPGSFGHVGPSLFLLPSGSTAARVRGAVIYLDAGGAPLDAPLGAPLGATRTVDFSDLFAELQGAHGIQHLNIEGAVVAGGFLRLLQRGNSTGSVNGVIDLAWSAVQEDLRRGDKLRGLAVAHVNRFDLGLLSGVRLSFTDAAMAAPDRLLFLAVAEATESSYDDAPCSGSVLGVIEGEPGTTNRLGRREPLSPVLKAEGLWIERRGSGGRHGSPEKGAFDLFVVTDDDDPARPAGLYHAEIASL